MSDVTLPPAAQDRKVTVPMLVEAIIAVYHQDGGAVGGGMHVQLDDGNLKDGHFDTEAEGWLRNDAERRCFALMKAASPTQRHKAVHLAQRFV